MNPAAFRRINTSSSFDGAFHNPHGMWLVYTWVVVAIPSTAHALLGAYDPQALNWIDPRLAGAMAALGKLGLDCSTPGLTGPLSQQFYINQVGFSVWGVLISTVITLAYMLSGRMKVADPEASVRRMVASQGITPRQAEIKLHWSFVWLILPGTALCVVLFFNGIYGWTPFHIQSPDWIVLVIFSVGTICISGTVIPVFVVAIGIWVNRDIQKVWRLLFRFKDR